MTSREFPTASPTGSAAAAAPAEQHRRLKLLVESALDLPPGDRDGFLRQECGLDENLLQQAQELLDLYSDDEIESAAEPEQIGPYRLITELGAGGMGVVYLAQREDGFSRTVAVKVMRRGMDTEFFLSRFQQEREILGALDHPGIVRIVDAGSTADGRPFLAMDFVDGVRIDTFCEPLNIRDRVSLFTRVCAAVQHAHRNLIVHRDLKPGNILVTPDGQPKLLDFGIAKVLDQEDSESTNATIPIMTRQYASPEQIRGQRINTASDVYALGLILYELLTGVRAYELKDMPAGDAERHICEIDPPEPSRQAPREIAAQLRGDLDRIVFMALRKEPERRYHSVEALSADLERYLQGRPVSAQNDTWAYRASKFVQRNRTSVAVASVMAVLLGGGIGSTLWQARIAGSERARAEREAALAKSSESEARRLEAKAEASAVQAEVERKRAEDKAAEADRQRLKSESRFREVRSLANSLLFEFHALIRNLPGATDARKLVITKSLEHLQLLQRDAAADPGLEAEIATAYEQLGQLQGAAGDAALGDTKGAFESQLKALEIRQRLAAKNPSDTNVQRDLGASHLRMAELLQALKQPGPALESAQKALGIYDALVRNSPRDVLSMLGLAASQQASGQAHEAAGKLRNALQSYTDHTETRRRIEASSPGDLELQTQTAEARDLEARAIELQGRFGDAIRIVEANGAIYRKAAASNPHNVRVRRNVIQNHRTLGSLAERTGDLSLARTNYERAVGLQKELVAEDPRNSRMLEDLVGLQTNLGATLMRSALPAEAALQYGQALDTAKELAARDPQNPAIRALLAGANLGLGQTLLETRQADQAQKAYESAIQIFEPLAASSPRDVNIQMNRALAHIGIGRILRDRGGLDQAERSLRLASSILEKIMPGSGDHRVLSNLAIAHNRLADVYRLQGKNALAIATYSRTEPIAAQLLKLDPRNAMAFTIRAEAMSRTGSIQEAAGDWSAALRSYQSAAEIEAQQSSRDPRDTRARENLAGSHDRICEVRFRLLQFQDAFDACAVAIRNWKMTGDRSSLSSALLRSGDIRMAQAAEDTAKAGPLRAEGCQFFHDAAAASTASSAGAGGESSLLEQRLEACRKLFPR
jgi:eukaryotic-like serine/threonine-protein kinase